MITYSIVKSPIGEIVAGTTTRGVCLFEFADRGGFERIHARILKRYGMEMTAGRNSLLSDIEKQAGEYFAGERSGFDLPLDQKGSEFERSVWNELMKIPAGATRSYGEIAKLLGRPGAARAVGRANGANYIAIIVPCHRVIQEDGSLCGYGGGLWRKQYLLDLEKRSTGGVTGEGKSVPERSIAVLS